jgi:hypothetical protein
MFMGHKAKRFPILEKLTFLSFSEMFIKSIRAPSYSSSDYGKSDNEKRQHTPIKMNGQEVPYASTAKYLSLTLDTKLG